MDGNLVLDTESARQNVLFADDFSTRFRKRIDAYLERQSLPLPPNEPDPADVPDPRATCVTPLDRLDLAPAGVQTIIWATGFTGNFDWLNLPVKDSDGSPIHKEGMTSLDGLYFIGFPWLSKRKSGIIYGIEEDARTIVEHIAARLV